jgi:hypothetical protein
MAVVWGAMGWPRWIVRPDWIAAACLAGCLGEFRADEDPKGGPGYACYHDLHCSPPLTCEEVSTMPVSVCGGSAAQGEACGPAVACRYERDSRGLPLGCTSEGTCEFPEGAAGP